MKQRFFAALAVLVASLAAPAMIVTPAAAQSEAAEFSDAELQSFADAVIEIRKIGQSYKPKLEAAETDVDKQAVRKAATTEMAAAIEDEGVTIERYKEIIDAARNDPELASRISGYVEAPQ